jgi:hypothetical protein
VRCLLCIDGSAYVPLSFAPGEACQFDWSHWVVLLNGVTVMVKAAHVWLCHSRMLFVQCYPRKTQEMVFDPHDRGFALFKGTCVRGIYDNMKTAVETIFVGKGHLYNRRFMQMCSHYLVDPVACTPAISASFCFEDLNACTAVNLPARCRIEGGKLRGSRTFPTSSDYFSSFSTRTPAGRSEESRPVSSPGGFSLRYARAWQHRSGARSRSRRRSPANQQPLQIDLIILSTFASSLSIAELVPRSGPLEALPPDESAVPAEFVPGAPTLVPAAPPPEGCDPPCPPRATAAVAEKITQRANERTESLFTSKLLHTSYQRPACSSPWRAFS